MRRLSLLLALSLSLTAVPAVAQDQAQDQEVSERDDEGGRRSAFRSSGGLLDRSVHTRPMELSFSVGLPFGRFWYGFGIGVGGRFYFPIVADGFIPSLNDEFGIEGGVDFDLAFGYYSGVAPSLGIPVAARWGFHLTDAWTVFAKLGIGIGLTFYPSGYYNPNYGAVWVLFEGSVGALWKLSDTISLRFDLGYPWAKVGIAIAL
jgi:hypothetical protein